MMHFSKAFYVLLFCVALPYSAGCFHAGKMIELPGMVVGFVLGLAVIEGLYRIPKP